MDAQLYDLIRLKQPPPAPVERWQMLPTRQRSSRHDTSAPTCALNSPLRPRTPNLANIPRTPESSKPVIKYKKTPKVHKTPGNVTKTPGNAKTPRSVKRRSPGNRKTPGHGQTPSGCRFIPNRSTTDLEYSSFLLQRRERDSAKEEEEEEEGSPSKEEYRQAVLRAVTRGRPTQKGVLSFSTTTPSISEGSFLNYTASMSASLTSSSICSSQKKPPHPIPTSAERILDAPELVDDYYLNTLDWGRSNQLAIGLGSSVFLWSAVDGSARELTDIGSENGYVSSVSWANNGKYLAIGGSDATIQLWDVEKEKRVRVMRGHSDRVGILTWNSHMLTSGSRDGSIHYHDVRKPEHRVGLSEFHQLEVCGLRWSRDGRQLASGGNDNLVCLWNASNPQEPVQIFRGHQAAVKAVSWCPWQPHILATGGGSSDKCIKFWNTSTGQCTETIDTKSQVSAIGWNREYREVISAHGNPHHQLTVWKYPSMSRVGELVGHQGRVLHMCLSPRKSTVASAGADETLRIWKCFRPSKKLDQSSSQSSEDSILALLRSVR